MSLIVIDASALVEVLLGTSRASFVERAVGGAEMTAPDLIDVEVLSSLRRLLRREELDAGRAGEAVLDLRAAPIERFRILPLIPAVWALRDNLSMYDACYVALAEALDCALVSGDLRLARAPRLPVQVIVPR